LSLALTNVIVIVRQQHVGIRISAACMLWQLGLEILSRSDFYGMQVTLQEQP